MAKDSAVNVVDHPEDGDVGGRDQVSFPSEFPAGELPDAEEAAAETLYKRPRQAKVWFIRGDLVKIKDTPEMGVGFITKYLPRGDENNTYWQVVFNNEFYRVEDRNLELAGEDETYQDDNFYGKHATKESESRQASRFRELSKDLALTTVYEVDKLFDLPSGFITGGLYSYYLKGSMPHAVDVIRRTVQNVDHISDEQILSILNDALLQIDKVLYGNPQFIEYFEKNKTAELGQGLTQLTTEREHGKPNLNLTEPARWNQSYTDENRFEDADGKLGDSDEDHGTLSEDVYPPYTDGIGQPNPRYEDTDKKRFDIVLHASEEEKIDPNAGPDYIWIAVDLDGTILEPPPDNQYESETGEHVFGQPIDGAREALQEMVDSGAVISIYTARQYFADGDDKENKLIEAVQNTLDEHEIPFTDVYVGKKPPAHYFIDDKGVSFTGDWGMVMDTIRDQLEKTANDPTKAIKDYQGIKMDVEWPKGSIRSYEGSDTYATHMKCDYGYAAGVEGSDGEELDIYLGPEDTEIAYVIEQMKDDGSYDEDKVMLGFASEEDATEMFLQHMPAYMLGEIRAVPIETLYNALYGEPEDRRGQDDIVPSEEKTAEDKAKRRKKKKTVKTKSDYVGPQSSQSGGIGLGGGPAGDIEADSDKESAQQNLAWKAINSLNNPEMVLLLSDPQYVKIDITKMDKGPEEVQSLIDGISSTMVADPEFEEKIESIVGSDPGITMSVHPKSDLTFNEQRLFSSPAEEIQLLEERSLELKNQQKKEEEMPLVSPEEFEQIATKTWPEDDPMENEFTDGTEDRENRDIPRPPETEKAKY